MGSPFSRFTDAEVREMLRGAGLPEVLDDDNVSRLGLARIMTQRELVLDAYARHPDVDGIFAALRGAVPKSSIRSYLCRAYPHGAWRQRSRRGSRHG
ncbi:MULTISPECIES: hypothetical protein [unclassified Mesorhizobium]|uniref:hypothetical protein n=1 Tax=unclassified Mesorhizobium TaxID=325217 RepID=UPI000FCB3D5F|nr:MULTISPECIES: hypothetical protein [unclassified Mesorhizobium]TGP22345.1 hypothetical protein EN874_019745 [Mesorhizobium sp. M1D.F.Ca.ET.231.01.1.1]TGP24685.1 hypothetical protein EN877_30450 [Mesorhizobium sp. M1D.F.Ca.ET.234.01.1.1]TGS37288.1 hypothetical protein EN827_30755 [Mesorhizobium sp. M1D.F.Ca.ET.184.01.1.1]TGS58088.1 hypothetical protein EN826_030730 [Mesorhizobium sp. M1D.F.Ca.ET.183.01.1.1]